MSLSVPQAKRLGLLGPEEAALEVGGFRTFDFTRLVVSGREPAASLSACGFKPHYGRIDLVLL